MRAPVILLKFLNQRQEHLFEYRIVLGAHEHLPLVHLLDIQVAVNWNAKAKAIQ